MSQPPLNPYAEWLGLPGGGERPDHYLLLGLSLFEADSEEINAAAARQVAQVGQHAATHKDLAQQVLKEIAAARQCLLDPAAKAAYDAQLGAEFGDPELSGEIPQVAEAIPESGTLPQAGAVVQPGEGDSQVEDPSSKSGNASGGDTLAELLPPGADIPGAEIPNAEIPADSPPSAGLEAPADNAAGEMAPPAAASVEQTGTSGAHDKRPAAAVPIATPVGGDSPPKTPGVHVAVEDRHSLTRERKPTASSGRRGHPPGGKRPSATVMGTAAAALFVVVAGVTLYALGVGPFAGGEDVARNADGQARNTDQSSEEQPTGDQSPPGGGDDDAANNDAQAPPSSNNGGSNNGGSNNGENAATDGDGASNDSPTTGEDTTSPATDNEERAAAVAALLTEAQIALGRRDFELSAERIAAAEAADANNAHAGQIAAAKALASAVDAFWSAARRTVGSLSAADEVTLGGQVMLVVQTHYDGVTFRQAGRTVRYAYSTMPPELAYALATSVLPEDATESKIPLAAFLIADATANRDRAAELLDEASRESMGANDQLIAQLRDQLAIARVANTATPTREDVPADSDAPPAFGERVAMPSSDELAATESVIQERFGERLALAISPEERLALAREIQEAAKGEPDAAIRFSLFVQATEQFKAANEIAAVLESLDLMADYFEVDSLTDKAQFLAEAARGAEHDHRMIAVAALELADDAVLLERYSEAVRLARTAQTAARTAQDGELVVIASTRVNAFGELLRAERGR